MSSTKFNCPSCLTKIDYVLPSTLIGDHCEEIKCSHCPAVILVDIQLDVKITCMPLQTTNTYKLNGK